ncbi:MAG: AraC family transcriptional regulator [Clostridiales bacterium]|nr:AraC family transcriptional regulator [Clostridiales bacterium]
MKLSEMKRITNFNSRQWNAMSPQEKRQARQDFTDATGTENLYQELEMSSPFVDAHEDVSYSPDADDVQLHSHTFYEVLCCRSGNIEYLIGADRYRVAAGDIIYVPPGVSHRPILPEAMSIPYRRYVLWVSQSFQEQIAANWPELGARAGHSGILRTAGTEWAFLQDTFRRGCEKAEREEPGWQMWLYGNTMQLMADMMRALSPNGPELALPEQRELVDHATLYVETHFSEKITLEGAAQALLVSQSALQQTFHNKLGVSFYRFVTQRRLTAAKNLILEGQPLTSVGEQVGFSDHSTFYRAFQKEYGISPSQYRKRLGGAGN